MVQMFLFITITSLSFFLVCFVELVGRFVRVLKPKHCQHLPAKANEQTKTRTGRKSSITKLLPHEICFPCEEVVHPVELPQSFNHAAEDSKRGLKIHTAPKWAILTDFFSPRKYIFNLDSRHIFALMS